MKIGLVQYEFKNIDIQFNLAQIEKAIVCSSGEVDLLCFGESFLQGFDSLSWDYAEDKNVAISQYSPEMEKVCKWSKEYDVALLVGYFEQDNESIYSSCAFINDGIVEHNYRRMSLGWKESSKTDYHYKEGESVVKFSFKGNDFEIALCGDLWDVTWERFKTDAIVLWPVYVNFSLEEWQDEEKEYAEQASNIANRVLMVNPLSDNPISHGGTFVFKEGIILSKLQYDVEDILIVEL